MSFRLYDPFYRPPLDTTRSTSAVYLPPPITFEVVKNAILLVPDGKSEIIDNIKQQLTESGGV